LLHQGSRFTSIDFILPLQPHHQRQEHHNWLVANCLSQSQALMQGRSREQLPETLSDLRRAHMEMPGNRPSNTIVMAQVTPASLGALIALYEHKVFCQARIWQINPFDQWGVELGKQLSETIYATINENSAPSQATSLDPSTQRLLSLYQNHNRSS
jgi:glucose-6-phosphate isomerase